jgi:hypothetical protein
MTIARANVEFTGLFPTRKPHMWKLWDVTNEKGRSRSGPGCERCEVADASGHRFEGFVISSRNHHHV